LAEEAWNTIVHGRPLNKLSIVCAGVGGEPLYKPVLIEAGLTEEELERLGEFYEFYEEYPTSGGPVAKAPAVTT